MKPWYAFLSAVLLFAALGSVAFAHAEIDHCTPGVSLTVSTAPSQVVCVFTEEISTKLSTMIVLDSSNTQVDKGDAHLDLNDPDHKTMIVTLDPGKMQNGIYTVKWHTVTEDDNGTTDGSFQFVVGSAAATPAPTTQVVQEPTATPTPIPGAPTTVQTSGADANLNWLALVVIGGLLVIGCLALKVTR